MISGAKLAVAAGVVVGLFFVVYQYGKAKHQLGVIETTTMFLEADKKGANNVVDTANEALAGIDTDLTPAELLRTTGGLRD